MASSPASPAKPEPVQLSWDEALEYRKKMLPSYVDPDDGKRHLMPYKSKVGRFCKDNAINRCCACGDGVKSDFVPFGSQITSTFKLQITLITVFAILTALAMPGIVINTYGVTATGGSAVFAVASTTIGNLPIIPAGNATEAFIDLPLTKTNLSIQRAAVIYAALDFIGVIVFVLTYAAVRTGLVNEDKQVNKAALGAERYSIFLPWVPSDTTEEELRTWALEVSKSKRNGVPDGFPVADINIVNDDVGRLRLYIQRGQIFRALARVDRAIKDVKYLIGDRKKNCCYDGQYAKLFALEKTYEQLKKRADDISERAKNFNSKGATAAFVTYDSPDARKVVLEKFPPSSTAYWCQAKKKKFKGHRIVVKAAPAPDTVQWANLNIKSGSQNARQCFTGLLAGILILLSFLFIVFASLENASVQESLAAPDCKEPGLAQSLLNGTYTNSSLLAMDISAKPLRCYCATLDWAKREWDDVVDDPFAEKCPEPACTRLLTISPPQAIAIGYCYSWLYQRVLAVGLTVGASLSIAVVNIMLSSCMRLMTAIEGHHSTDDLNKSLVVRLFFAQFLNTAILTLIINAAWDTITGQNLPIPGTGKYDDFTSAWYGSVGSAYHSTMITLAISPHIGTIIGMLGKFRMVKNAQTQIDRRKAIETADRSAAEAKAIAVSGEVPASVASKKAKPLPKPVPVPKNYAVQIDLNEAFVGPPADYVLRYVQMLTTVFVCYIFAAGMPALLPIACGSLVISHLVDKAAFLYFHRRPPASNNGTVRYAVELLPVAALLHLGIGIWMLGSLSTLRDALLDASGLSDQFAYLQAAGGSMLRSGILKTGYQRITQVQSLPLLALFAVVLAGLVLRLVLGTVGTILYSLLDALTGGRLARLKTCCRCCCPKKGSGLPSYTEATSPALLGTANGINGVRSYNVLDNPTLQVMFGIGADFARTNKGLAAVATFSADDAIAAANAQNFARAMEMESGMVEADVPVVPPQHHMHEHGHAGAAKDGHAGARGALDESVVMTNPMHAAASSTASASSGYVPADEDPSSARGAPVKPQAFGGLAFIKGSVSDE